MSACVRFGPAQHTPVNSWIGWFRAQKFCDKTRTVPDLVGANRMVQRKRGIGQNGTDELDPMPKEADA